MRITKSRGLTDILEALVSGAPPYGGIAKFNQRRNRVVHQLWIGGYSATNEKLEPACRGAFIIFGLLIEGLETFDPEITESGFEYDKE